MIVVLQRRRVGPGRLLRFLEKLAGEPSTVRVASLPAASYARSVRTPFASVWAVARPASSYS